MKIGVKTERVEFKKSTGELKEAIKSMVAILNKHGSGELYFGVDNDGLVCGQQVSDSTLRDISRMIYESVEPAIVPQIEVKKIEDKTIVCVYFSGYNRPYSAYGLYLMRIGTENRVMGTDELKKLMQSIDYACKWDKEISNKTMADIDEEALKSYYAEGVACGRISLATYHKEELLDSLSLSRGEKLTNAGNALFGKDAQIGLKLAVFATDSKVTFLDLKMYSGNIYTLISKAYEYVAEKINYQVKFGKLFREEIPEIPLEAVREIIVNAFAHAYYENAVTIEINIHPGSIQIANPGSFPYGLTPYDFIRRRLSSYKRNPLIMETLFRCKGVEESGTGLLRVDELCRQNNVRWHYQDEQIGFAFVFDRKAMPQSEGSQNSDREKDLYAMEEDNSNALNELSDVETAVYHTIRQQTYINKEEISALIGKSEKTVQRAIATLKELGLLERVGSNKTGHWRAKS